MPPQTRYARCGDLSIAYQVIGDGPRDLVIVPGWVWHIALFWNDPGYHRFMQALTGFARVIAYDKRGTGLSDPVPAAPSLDERMDDVRAELGIRVRAGLHTGECEQRGEDVGGVAVHIGARIGALATPGEVLVSGTVRDLVLASGIGFSDRGDHTLKGVPGEWRLFAVADTAPPTPVTDGADVRASVGERAMLRTMQRAPALGRAAGRALRRRRSSRESH
jgi:pimeloyl-ACP methyl ester carboxylesterase